MTVSWRAAALCVLPILALVPTASPAQADRVRVTTDGYFESIRLDHTDRRINIVTRAGMPTELVLRVEARVNGRVRTYNAYYFDESDTFDVYNANFSERLCSKYYDIEWVGDTAVYSMSFPRRCFGRPTSVRVKGIAKPDPALGGTTYRSPWSRWAGRG